MRRSSCGIARRGGRRSPRPRLARTRARRCRRALRSGPSAPRAAGEVGVGLRPAGELGDRPVSSSSACGSGPAAIWRRALASLRRAGRRGRVGTGSERGDGVVESGGRARRGGVRARGRRRGGRRSLRPRLARSRARRCRRALRFGPSAPRAGWRLGVGLRSAGELGDRLAQLVERSCLRVARHSGQHFLAQVLEMARRACRRASPGPRSSIGRPPSSVSAERISSRAVRSAGGRCASSGRRSPRWFLRSSARRP